MSPEAYLLADQHGGLWQEHDTFKRSDWKQDVESEATQDGYWDCIKPARNGRRYPA